MPSAGTPGRSQKRAAVRDIPGLERPPHSAALAARTSRCATSAKWRARQAKRTRRWRRWAGRRVRGGRRLASRCTASEPEPGGSRDSALGRAPSAESAFIAVCQFPSRRQIVELVNSLPRPIGARQASRVTQLPVAVRSHRGFCESNLGASTGESRAGRSKFTRQPRERAPQGPAAVAAAAAEC